MSVAGWSKHGERDAVARGYKLATLRTLLDSAGLLTQVALSAIQVHDMALCRPLPGGGAGVRLRWICSSKIGAFTIDMYPT